MKLQNFFDRHPLFTHDEIAEYLVAEGERSPRTTDSLLAYHVRSGRLRRIRRGLYAVGDTPVDPYLVASRLTDDAVLAYHTALEIHGRAHSVHQQATLLSRHRLRPLSLGGFRFRALAPPKALRDRSRETTGVETVDRAGLDIRITSLERTLVDVLDRPDLGGGWEEVWRSLETVEFFELSAVVEYALLLDNATTTAKVGLFLEEHRDTLFVGDDVLKSLRNHRPQKPHYVDRGSHRPSRLVAGWNLLVPEDLFLRSWAEVV